MRWNKERYASKDDKKAYDQYCAERDRRVQLEHDCLAPIYEHLKKELPEAGLAMITTNGSWSIEGRHNVIIRFRYEGTSRWSTKTGVLGIKLVCSPSSYNSRVRHITRNYKYDFDKMGMSESSLFKIVNTIRKYQSELDVWREKEDIRLECNEILKVALRDRFGDRFKESWRGLEIDGVRFDLKSGTAQARVRLDINKDNAVEVMEFWSRLKKAMGVDDGKE